MHCAHANPRRAAARSPSRSLSSSLPSLPVSALALPSNTAGFVAGSKGLCAALNSLKNAFIDTGWVEVTGAHCTPLSTRVFIPWLRVVLC